MTSRCGEQDVETYSVLYPRKTARNVTELENELDLLTQKLKGAHVTIKNMHSQMELQKRRTKQLITSWKVRLEEGEDKIRNLRLEKDREMKEIVSNLLFVEGRIKHEQKQIVASIAEKDRIIGKQKVKIDALMSANAQLVSALQKLKVKAGINGVASIQPVCKDLDTVSMSPPGSPAKHSPPSTPSKKSKKRRSKSTADIPVFKEKNVPARRSKSDLEIRQLDEYLSQTDNVLADDASEEAIFLRSLAEKSFRRYKKSKSEHSLDRLPLVSEQDEQESVEQFETEEKYSPSWHTILGKHAAPVLKLKEREANKDESNLKELRLDPPAHIASSLKQDLQECDRLKRKELLLETTPEQDEYDQDQELCKEQNKCKKVSTGKVSEDHKKSPNTTCLLNDNTGVTFESTNGLFLWSDAADIKCNSELTATPAEHCNAITKLEGERNEHSIDSVDGGQALNLTVSRGDLPVSKHSPSLNGTHSCEPEDASSVLSGTINVYDVDHVQIGTLDLNETEVNDLGNLSKIPDHEISLNDPCETPDLTESLSPDMPSAIRSDDQKKAENTDIRKTNTMHAMQLQEVEHTSKAPEVYGDVTNIRATVSKNVINEKPAVDTDVINYKATGDTGMDNYGATMDTHKPNCKASEDTDVDNDKETVDADVTSGNAHMDTNEDRFKAKVDTDVDNYITTVDTYVTSSEASVDTNVDSLKGKVDTDVTNCKASVDMDGDNYKATVDTDVHMDTNEDSLKANVDTDGDNYRTTVDTDVTSCRTSLDKNVDSFKAKLDTDVDNYKATVDTDVDNYKATVDTDVDNYKATVETDVTRCRTSLDTDEDSFKAKVDTDADSYKATVDTDVTSCSTSVDMNVDISKATVDTDVTNSKASVDTDVNDCKASMNTDVASCKASADTDLDSCEATVDVGVTGIEASVVTGSDNYGTSVDMDVTDYKIAIDADVDNETATVDTDVTNCKAILDTDMPNCESAVDTHVSTCPGIVGTDGANCEATVDTVVPNCEATVDTDVPNCEASVDTVVPNCEASVDTVVPNSEATVDNVLPYREASMDAVESSCEATVITVVSNGEGTVDAVESTCETTVDTSVSDHKAPIGDSNAADEEIQLQLVEEMCNLSPSQASDMIVGEAGDKDLIAGIGNSDTDKGYTIVSDLVTTADTTADTHDSGNLSDGVDLCDSIDDNKIVQAKNDENCNDEQLQNSDINDNEPTSVRISSNAPLEVDILQLDNVENDNEPSTLVNAASLDGTTHDLSHIGAFGGASEKNKGGTQQLLVIPQEFRNTERELGTLHEHTEGQVFDKVRRHDDCSNAAKDDKVPKEKKKRKERRKRHSQRERSKSLPDGDKDVTGKEYTLTL